MFKKYVLKSKDGKEEEISFKEETSLDLAQRVKFIHIKEAQGYTIISEEEVPEEEYLKIAIDFITDSMTTKSIPDLEKAITEFDLFTMIQLMELVATGIGSLNYVVNRAKEIGLELVLSEDTIKAMNYDPTTKLDSVF